MSGEETMQVRFDPQRAVYRDCRWCVGKGCLYCASEADKAYRADFPDGPTPIATFTVDELPAAKDAIGADAMRKAFGPGGGGVAEIIANVAKLRATTTDEG
jgi:hypothetical protein